MSLSKPNQIAVPFADAGLKAAIPANADNVLGRAGYDQGFPPINMTAKVAGGIPPFGQDMNGILYAIDQAVQYHQAGMIYPYDSTFATAIGGYNIGAKVLRSDGFGAWINTVNNNTTNPDTGGSGWVPDYTYGIAAVTMTGSNVTLTATQYGQTIINITGTLTANVQLLFPNSISGRWSVFNNTTGAFTITAKTISGTGVSLSSGVNSLIGDGTNIYTSSLPISSTAQSQAWTNDSTAISPLKLAQAFQGANQSLGSSGYQKLPGGFIVQWGTATTNASGQATVTFHIAFPTQCRSAVTNDSENVAASVSYGAVSFSGSPGTAMTLTYARNAVAYDAGLVTWIAFGN